MDKTKIKYLVGIYAAAMCIMGMLVPVPIVASVAAAFSNENIAAVQMIIGIIPLMMALSAMLVSSQLASRVSKKKTTLVGHVIVMLAGASVLVFHDSLGQVLAASAVMGLIWTMVSGILGSAEWFHSYAAYFIMIIFIVIEAVCLPEGHLEPKRKVNVFANMPKEVAIITVMSFVFVLTFQLFSSNVSLLVVGRGFGGTVEAGLASTVMTVAGIAAGLLVGPLFAKFKNLAMPIAWGVTLVGLGLTLVAPAFMVLCVAGFVVALGKETYVPLEGNFAAGNSAPEGRAFNLAIGMAGINFGMALSPIVFEAVTSPFGATIDQKFIAGMIVCAACVVFGAIKYRKLTPAQLAEAEKMAASGEAE